VRPSLIISFLCWAQTKLLKEPERMARAPLELVLAMHFSTIMAALVAKGESGES
jgi:hypothetical protein